MIVVNSIDCYLTGRRSKLRFRRRLSWTTYGNGSCVRCDHFLRATKPAGAGAGSLGIVSALPGSWLTTAATDKWKISFISTAVTTYFLKIDMCIVKIFTRRKFERFFSYFCDRCNFSELLWKKKKKLKRWSISILLMLTHLTALLDISGTDIEWVKDLFIRARNRLRLQCRITNVSNVISINSHTDLSCVLSVLDCSVRISGMRAARKINQ